MRAVAPLLLLLAACGGETLSASFTDAAAMAKVSAVHVAGMHARMRVRGGPAGRIDVTVRSAEGFEGLPVAFEAKGESLIVELAPVLAKRAGTEIEVTAPEGLDLVVMGGDGAVEVSGSWRRLVARTSNGAIAARVGRAEAGELESYSGAIEFVAKGAGPTGDFTAKSIRGAVTVRVPATWNGQIKVSSKSGTLDVPPHEGLRTLWEEDRKGLVGHVGNAPPKGTILSALWAASATGNVSFRLD